MARTLTAALRGEYALLFSRMSFRPESLAQIARIYRIARSATAQAAYRHVEAATGVPWFATALIHNLESSQRFDAHLHNGDTLRQRTTRVPRGRLPDAEPPYAWHQSAIDALKQKSLHKWDDWTVPGIAYVLESYNGFGYRNNFPHVKSPYLWSFSSIYSAGKYIADGQFSETAVSKQCGGMTLLRHIMDHEPDVARTVGFTSVADEGDDTGGAAEFPSIEGPEGTPPAELVPAREPPPRYPGRYLLVPIEDDPAVLLVQKRLQALRIDTGAIDGDYGVITQHAVRLFQSRAATPAGEPLEIDGIVGPQTWVALFGERSANPAPGQDFHDGVRTWRGRSSMSPPAKWVCGRRRWGPTAVLALISTSDRSASIRQPPRIPGACASCTGATSRLRRRSQSRAYAR